MVATQALASRDVVFADGEYGPRECVSCLDYYVGPLDRVIGRILSEWEQQQDEGDLPDWSGLPRHLVRACESELEKALARAVFPHLREYVEMRGQTTFGTRWHRRRFDFEIEVGPRRVGLEADGPHHKRRFEYDRRRDAVILAQQRADAIYRFQPWIIRNHPEFVAPLLQAAEPSLVRCGPSAEIECPEEWVAALAPLFERPPIVVRACEFDDCLEPVVGHRFFEENHAGAIMVVHSQQTMRSMVGMVSEFSTLQLREWCREVEAFGKLPMSRLSGQEAEEYDYLAC